MHAADVASTVASRPKGAGSQMENRRLKICVVEPSGQLYGSEFCLLDILDGLQQRFEWEVILPRGRGFDEILARNGHAGVFLFPGNSASRFKALKLTCYARIGFHLARWKPDVLYVNQAGVLRSMELIARRLRIPVVCQVQTLEDARFLSRIGHSHGAVRAFVCNSKYIAEQTAVAPDKKCVFYQGIPSERVERARTSPLRRLPIDGREQVRIGLLGRIAKSKGHYLLLEAAKALGGQVPHSVRFVIIGEGLRPEDTEQFKAAVHEAGLAERFEFRGYRKDVSGELARLHLMVIPSLAEPLGRVLFDAAEAGLPAIVADSGGLGEIARRYHVGCQFSAGDPVALASAIAAALRNYPAEVAKFRAASTILLESLDMNAYLEQIEDVLRRAARRENSALEWFGSVERCPAAVT